MIKNLKGWVTSKKLKNANVYMRDCAAAKARCMKDHIKPKKFKTKTQSHCTSREHK